MDWGMQASENLFGFESSQPLLYRKESNVATITFKKKLSLLNSRDTMVGQQTVSINGITLNVTKNLYDYRRN